MRGTLSGRSLYIFQATLQLTLRLNLWKLRSSAGMSKVTWCSESKGHGFLFRKGRPGVFVHHRKISGEGFRALEQGQEVEFEMASGATGP
jgi:CspA family cold shock protein